MGTQVITRDTGRRLGVVGEVMVDIDRREVVALGLRDNPLTRFLPGLPRWMPLERIRQVGDVILVDSADSLAEGFDPDRFSKVINCQVITESGAQLGRVLGFSFDVETGELTTLVIGALGVPLLGEGVLSTWEMPVGEIVSSGSDRIIVYEGAEEKLKQLGTGLLEKLGIGGSSWEQEERERYRGSAVPAENQLPAGQPSQLEQRRIQPATNRSFQPEEEFDYVELEERREREPLRQRRYLDEEDDNRFGRFRDDEDSRRAAPLRNDSYGAEQLRDEDPSPYSPRRGSRENGLDAPEREGRDRNRPDQDWRREAPERFADQPAEGWRKRRIAADGDEGLDLEQPLPRERSQPRPRLDQEAPQPASNRRPSVESYPRISRSGSADPERNSKLVDVDVEPLDDPW
ncbi:MAG: PRC-barrel domain-containing protein [Cyanobacteria bacterium]|nr:PRC-barrel domain-containing protein [Cyanobacteriota bacterium]